jgi:hypothetical protein
MLCAINNLSAGRVSRKLEVAFTLCCGGLGRLARDNTSPLVLFEEHRDLGTVRHQGTAEFDPSSEAHTLTGRDKNMWFASGDFHKNAIQKVAFANAADNKTKFLIEFMGGPGSLGSNPWSPDSKRLVFVSYQALP